MTAEMTVPDWIGALRPRFEAVFERSETPGIALAPGRVNLIGEHTDYNDGWVLPMAIDRRVGVACAPREDRILRAHSVVYGATEEVRLDELTPPGGSEWIDYVAGVAWAMASEGHEISGADLLIDGDVPLASGLSSSAAIEMSVALALCDVSGCTWSPVEMAWLGQRVEREWIGIQGGVMDQYTATMGREGHALLLDCRSLSSSAVPFPDAAVVVVMDTGAPRTLAGSAYNEHSP